MSNAISDYRHPPVTDVFSMMVTRKAAVSDTAPNIRSQSRAVPSELPTRSEPAQRFATRPGLPIRQVAAHLSRRPEDEFEPQCPGVNSNANILDSAEAKPPKSCPNACSLRPARCSVRCYHAAVELRFHS